MAALASRLADRFSISPLKPLNRIQRHLTGSKISTFSIKFLLFGPIGKNGSKITMFSTNFVVFFFADRKNKIAALADPSKRWHIELRCMICGLWALCFLFSWKMGFCHTTESDLFLFSHSNYLIISQAS